MLSSKASAASPATQLDIFIMSLRIYGIGATLVQKRLINKSEIKNTLKSLRPALAPPLQTELDKVIVELDRWRVRRSVEE
jgi:hypothetical protein